MPPQQCYWLHILLQRAPPKAIKGPQQSSYGEVLLPASSLAADQHSQDQL